MSFDRVLPRPPALFDDATTRIHRPTSSLLEHKIMNRDNHMPRSPISLQHKLNTNGSMSDSCSTAMSQMKLSSINREKMAENGHIQPGAFPSPRTPSRTSNDSIIDMPMRDRSASGSPTTKLEAAKEAASQFCLCQPDPKIPRPRNGEFHNAPFEMNNAGENCWSRG